MSGTGTGWSCSAAGQTVTCTTAGSLAAGESTTLTLTVGVDPAAIPGVTNSATVAVIGDSDPSDNVANDDTIVVAANGDFNADGKADILWHHSTSGMINMWMMDGINPVDIAYVGTVSDPDWHIERTADLNGDGQADILWRHHGTGQVYAWLMNGQASR